MSGPCQSPGGSSSRSMRETGSTRPTAHVRAAVPSGRRRARADPVSPGACLRPDDRAVPRMQTETPMRCERPARNRTSRRRVSQLPPRADGGTRPPLATTHFLSLPIRILERDVSNSFRSRSRQGSPAGLRADHGDLDRCSAAGIRWPSTYGTFFANGAWVC